MEKIFLHHIRNAVAGAAGRDRSLYQQIVSYMDLRSILGHDGEIPPLRGFAISPDMAMFLLRLVGRLKPLYVLELGSGFSSVILARHCAAVGGRVISLDHDAEYVRRSRDLLQGWGLEELVDVTLAPMQTYQPPGGAPFIFYAVEPLRAAGRRFDFVFLDGPPMSFGPTVRQGFLPLFGEFLRPGCHILLDDYYRKGEQDVVSAWVKEGLVDVVRIERDLEKHAALLAYRGPGVRA